MRDFGILDVDANDHRPGPGPCTACAPGYPRPCACYRITSWDQAVGHLHGQEFDGAVHARCDICGVPA